jgi:TonB family protein
MSAGWAKLETHLVNGAFSLKRCVGSSERSGVFLTQSAKHAPSTVALKLIHFDPGSADAQLSRWRSAVDLSHPHLIRLFEAGECHVSGLHCLYLLMEYAEENLAQLLEQRALAEHEVREMLEPTLSALAYLHGRKLIQGQLKPSNILVVGDELKLASDTVRPVGDPAAAVNEVSVYDAPETREGHWSAAGDIWALGVTLCEALTRRQPSGLHGAGEVELPSDLAGPFREVVAKCLSRNPQDRPQVSQLQSWLRGESLATQPKPRPPQTSTVRLVIRARILPDGEEPKAELRHGSSKRTLPLALGVVAVLVLGWVAYRVFRADAPPASTASELVRDAKPSTPAPVPAPAAPVDKAASASGELPPPDPATSAAVAEAGVTAPITEVIPDVPRSALQTIRGTVRVSVRVILNSDGTVLAATPDDPGPSRYFERLAVEASRKWTFTPADRADQRLMLVRFNFTRTGATASAAQLR